MTGSGREKRGKSTYYILSHKLENIRTLLSTNMESPQEMATSIGLAVPLSARRRCSFAEIFFLGPICEQIAVVEKSIAKIIKLITKWVQKKDLGKRMTAPGREKHGEPNGNSGLLWGCIFEGKKVDII